MLDEELKKLIIEAEEYFEEMHFNGYVTDEWLDYHDMIEKIIEKLKEK